MIDDDPSGIDGGHNDDNFHWSIHVAAGWCQNMGGRSSFDNEYRYEASDSLVIFPHQTMYITPTHIDWRSSYMQIVMLQ